MRGLLLVLAFLLTTDVKGQGWTEFERAIGDDYEIRKIAETTALYQHGKVVIEPQGGFPGGFTPVSEIVRYGTDDVRVYLKCYGLSSRGPGASINWNSPEYFVVEKVNNAVTGPLSQQDFGALGYTPKWRRPLNPVAGPVLAMVATIVAIPVLFVVGLVLLTLVGTRSPKEVAGPGQTSLVKESG